MGTKQTLKKVWWFIWESDSIWSWIVCIILAFVLIKFIVYPGLGFAFQTSHPIVAVVSSSMEHEEGSFDSWWNSSAVCGDKQCTQADFYSELNITKEQFLDFKFKNGFNKGDIIFLYGTSVEKIKPGDVLVFRSGKPDPIIHRVISKELRDGKYYFQTKGDNNVKSIKEYWLDEYNIPEDAMIGRGLFKVPYLGWVKIGFVELINLFR
jgi:signal peptidase I